MAARARAVVVVRMVGGCFARVEELMGAVDEEEDRKMEM